MTQYYITMKTDLNTRGELFALKLPNEIEKRVSVFEEYLDMVADRLPMMTDEYATKTEEKDDMGQDVFGYIMPDEWKRDLIEAICDLADLDEIDEFICEIGFRRAIEYASSPNSCGLDDIACPMNTLGTDEGMRELFVAIMWGMLEFADGVKEVEKEEYIAHFPQDDNQSDNESDDESE